MNFFLTFLIGEKHCEILYRPTNLMESTCMNFFLTFFIGEKHFTTLPPRGTKSLFCIVTDLESYGKNICHLQFFAIFYGEKHFTTLLPSTCPGPDMSAPSLYDSQYLQTW